MCSAVFIVIAPHRDHTHHTYLHWTCVASVLMIRIQDGIVGVLWMLQDAMPVWISGCQESGLSRCDVWMWGSDISDISGIWDRMIRCE